MTRRIIVTATLAALTSLVVLSPLACKNPGATTEDDLQDERSVLDLPGRGGDEEVHHQSRHFGLQARRPRRVHLTTSRADGGV
jgi:hypothetical protein